MLLTAATKLSAISSPKFYANPEPLQAALAALEMADAEEHFEEFTQCNTAFHRLIVQTSGNNILLRVWDSLAFEIWTRINLVLVG